MVQSLRADFILYVITIKCIKVDLIQKFRKSLLSYNDKATIKNCVKIIRGGKKIVFCCPGGHLPPHGYGPGERGAQGARAPTSSQICM